MVKPNATARALGIVSYDEWKEVMSIAEKDPNVKKQLDRLMIMYYTVKDELKETRMRIIAGPCQHETLAQSAEIAEECKRVCDMHGIEYIFKASYDKANRSSEQGKRGIGLGPTLEDFRTLKKQYNIQTLTDVHDELQVEQIMYAYGDAVDVLQIPAFLCRQTDLLTSGLCYRQNSKY